MSLQAPDSGPAAIETPPRETSRRFRSDIEGLRAVAVLSVVLFHAGVPFLPGGYVGVDVFFVVSGFLITGLLVREVDRTGRVSLAQFYTRRVRRLIPMATTVLLATLIASLFILNPLDLEDLSGAAVAAATFWANWFFAVQTDDYFATSVGSSPVLHFWSLSIEEQFYVVWPALLIAIAWLCTKFRARPARRTIAVCVGLGVITAVSLIMSIRGATAGSGFEYFGLQSRLWELGFGALLAVLTPVLVKMKSGVVSALLGWVGLAMIVYAAVRFTSETPFPGSAALVPVVGTCLVIFAGLRPAERNERFGAARVLSVAPMQYVGARSYNLYLWHWPALVLIGTLMASPDELESMTSGHVATPSAAVVAVLVACALTVVTYRLIEQPLRSSAWMKKSRLALPAAAIAIAGTVVAALALPGLAVPVYAGSGGGPTGTSQAQIVQQARIVADEELLAGACQVKGPDTDIEGDLATSESDQCIFGDRNGNKRVLFAGDSQAGAWLPAIDAIGKQEGWAIYTRIRTACWYASEAEYLRPGLTSRFTLCPVWNQRVQEELLKDAPFDAVILMRSQEHLEFTTTEGERDKQITEQLSHALGFYGRITQKIVILEDRVISSKDIPRCLLSNRGDSKPCEPNRESGLSQEKTLVAFERQAASTLPTDVEVVFVQTADLFCSRTLSKCPVVGPDGEILYKDRAHLPAGAALAVVPALEKRLAPAVTSSKAAR